MSNPFKYFLHLHVRCTIIRHASFVPIKACLFTDNAIYIDKVGRYTPFQPSTMIEVCTATHAENTEIVNQDTSTSDSCTIETHDLVGLTKFVEGTKYVPSTENKEDAINIHSKKVVLDTCQELLVKLEEIRTSVLHMQYSIHAGALGGAAVENTERAQQLWAWDKGGVFSAEVSAGIIHGALNNVFSAGFPETSDENVDTESEKSVNEILYGKPTEEEEDFPAAECNTADHFAIDSPDTVPSSSDLITNPSDVITNPGCHTDTFPDEQTFPTDVATCVI
jgi:hypothetical protein